MCTACDLCSLYAALQHSTNPDHYVLVRLSRECPRAQVQRRLAETPHADGCIATVMSDALLQPCDDQCMFCHHIVARHTLLDALNDVAEVADTCLAYLQKETDGILDDRIDWTKVEEGVYRRRGYKQTIRTATGAFEPFEVAPLYDIPDLTVQVACQLAVDKPSPTFQNLWQTDDIAHTPFVGPLLNAALGQFLRLSPPLFRAAVTVRWGRSTIRATFEWVDNISTPMLCASEFSIISGDADEDASSVWTAPNLCVLHKTTDMLTQPLIIWPFSIYRSGPWLYLFYVGDVSEAFHLEYEQTHPLEFIR